MKAKQFVLALILALSVMSTPLVKADTGGGNPQNGNEITKKCPQGYVLQGGQCKKVQPAPGTNGPNQPNNRTVVTTDESGIDYALLMEVMGDVLFGLISNIY